MTSAPTADRVVDCRDTYCPVPIVRLRQEIDQIEPGQVIKIIATDPASAQDMPAFARNTGHALLHTAKEGNAFEYYFRKQDELA